jgi:PAS domain S-box-containing protein
MGLLNPYGITAVLLGLALLGAAVLLLRILPRFQSPPLNPLPALPGIQESSNAFLLIQAGGRVLYANEEARKWFGLLEDEPNLERLARQARPNDVFIGLCASQGQARLTINGRFVEGTSYFIPYGKSSALLVSLVHSQALVHGERAVSDQVLSTFAEVSRAMTASLDLDKTLQCVLESVERLTPADSVELTLLDREMNHLVPYRLIGLPEIDRRLEKGSERYKHQDGYSGYILKTRKPLLVHDIDTFREAQPIVERKRYPYQSYLGVPLLSADDLVGTLELASLAKNAFTHNEDEIVRLIAGQAAAAIHNAQLYQEEQHRILELSGLSQMTQAVSALQDPKDLFSRLVDSVRSLIPVEMIGFWLYNEPQHRLEAQVPFVGLPTEITSYYYIQVEPNSPAEKILLAQEITLTADAPRDTQMETLGLAELAQAAGVKHSLLAPMASAGRLVGLLQVSNKIDGEPFSQNDVRILAIVASQAAVIIENATLVQQTQQRAMRSEALRRIASLTGSAATLDEVLQYSLRELARLLQADTALIYLVDENRGNLRLHHPSIFGLTAETGKSLGQASIELTDSVFSSENTESQRAILTSDAFEDIEALPIYRNLILNQQLRSVINVPLVIRDRIIGEVMLANRAANFYDRSDIIIVATAAGQLASAIEQSILYKQTDQGLREKVEQLTSLARISREMNSSTDLEQIVKLVYEAVVKDTNADCGVIYIFDKNRSNGRLHVHFRIGEGLENQLSSLEMSVLEREEPILIDDYEPNQGWQGASHWLPPHQGIRSSLLVPIASQKTVIGLIHLHALKRGHFKEMTLETVQALAGQAGAAIDNFRRFQEQYQQAAKLNRRLETLNNLVDTIQLTKNAQSLEIALQTAALGLQKAAPFGSVLISVYEAQTQSLQLISCLGEAIEWGEGSHLQELTWEELQRQIRSELPLERIYWFSANRNAAGENPATETRLWPVGELSLNGEGIQADESLLLPLFAGEEELLGVVIVGHLEAEQVVDALTLETLKVYSAQIALMIESSQQMQDYKARAETVERDLSRALQAVETGQSSLPALLHKDLEQRLAIQGLSRRSRRIRAGMDIAEIVNRQPDRSQVLKTLGGEILTRMDLDVVMVAEPSPGGLRLVHTLGAVPAGINPEAMLGQRNPVRQCMQTGKSIFVHNLEDESEWNGAPLLQSLDANAFICMVIPKEETVTDPAVAVSGSRKLSAEKAANKPAVEVDAVLLAISLTPMAAFTDEDQQLFTMLARQVAIALQNQRLLSETSRRLREVNLLLDFSRQLGSLDPLQILHTLADSIIHLLPAVHSCVVALWDEKEQALIPQVALGYPNNQRLLEIRYRMGEALPGLVYESGRALRVDEVIFSRHYNLPPESLLCYRDGTGGRLPVSNLIVPISGPVHPGKELDTMPLGVIILDNFQMTAAFTQEDLALITSLMQQTALTLENARLYQASEQRAIQLQTLTNVASTITSSLQTNELIASLLDQVKAILPYDTGTLWLRQGHQLTIRAALGFEDSEERVGLSAAISESLLLKEMIDTGLPSFVDDVREDERFPSLIEHKHLSWLGIPLMAKGEVVGVIALEKKEAGYYTAEQIQAATTFAGQAAVALENANLYEDSLRRTTDLDQRSNRLALLNRLSTELSSSMDPAYILKLTGQELLLALNCSAVSAVMFDKEGHPVLRAETPQTTLELPLVFPQAPLFERLKESLGVYNLEDVLNSDREVNELFAPLSEYLEERSTRALLVLSLATGSELHGVIFAHKIDTYRFSADEVELARTICNQAAVAVQNAALFAETQLLYAESRQRSGALGNLFELGVKLSQILDQQHLIGTVFEHLSSLLGINSIALVLENEQGELTAEIVDRGEKIGPIPIEKSGASLSEYVIETGRPLIFGDVERERDLYPVAPPSGGEVRSWLGMPLTVRGATIGVISVQSNEPHLFRKEQISLVGQVANQLATAIDNTRLISTVQSYAADLEMRVVERTAELAREHERTETLLAIITELSTSLDMDIVLTRTLDLINETVKAEHSQIILSLPEEKTLFLRAWVGYNKPLKKGGQLTNFMRHEGLAGYVISKRQAVLIQDLTQEPRWVSHDIETDQHKSALAVPLMMGEDTLGALLLFHSQTGQFSEDQFELVQATAQQIAVAINNAQLFNLIRDQAERLGDMLRQQHVETSRSQAILEAVADGVLVTDAQRVITLFNASAEQILGMQRRQVLGRSLEHFTGLFGKTAHDWVETIRKWSEDPSSYQVGDVYSEQIQLDDMRVVSVHLSPVYLRTDFLGTVSTFRDITHQVEVDRLKSEFVATVSHELRTPMTAIKGYVEVLLMGAAGHMNEQQAHFLQIVKNNTERLAVLVNDLLDISRIEAGKVVLSMQGLDICSIVKDAAAELERRTLEENKPMHIKLHLPAALPRIVGDSERVRQMVDNLLENAFYYTHAGGDITLRAHQQGAEVQIDVQDNGIGIPAVEQPRVFERFYRGEDPLVLASSGTGLGLSIVKRLIEMHNGRIWLSSQGIPGEGSTFSFTLPVEDVEL